MFKFAINQHVWFLVGPMSDDEDPEYLEGDITKRYTDDEWHDSPVNMYEIQSGGDIYERDEEDLYASFEELDKAVTEDLQYWVDHARQRVKEIKEELAKARADREAAKKRLARWKDRPPLMLSEDAIKEMDTWKGFGPHGPCPRCGSKYYNRANSKTDWWLCCDCGFSYKEPAK